MMRLNPAEASLDAAGITDPLLRSDFEECRQLHASHGRTYYLATWLLPAARRPWVWALYGFARHCDELIDADPPQPQELVQWTDRFAAALDSGNPGWDSPSRALLATHRRIGLPVAELQSFADAMRADIEVSRYQTYADLQGYMAGSACAIGSLMLPVLSSRRDEPSVQQQARDLGEAFQLTNFLRDVGEDLDRGRIYLPLEDLARFGVSEQDVKAMHDGAPVTDAWRNLMRFEIARNREIYARARLGIDALDPGVREGIRCAYILYGEILDAIEADDFHNLTRRARVPKKRQTAVAARGVGRILMHLPRRETAAAAR